jgi:hypothetical protein
MNLAFLRRREARLDGGLELLAARIGAAGDTFNVPLDAKMRAKARLHASLASARAGRQSGRKGWLAAQSRPVMAGAALAFILVLGAVSVGLLSRGGPSSGVLTTPSAEAIVLEGTLVSSDGQELLVLTAQGRESISLETGPPIVDAAGNPLPVQSLAAGQTLSIKARRDEHAGLVIDEIQATGEVRGRITGLSTAQVEITGENVSIAVLLTPSTAIEGVLRPGVLIEADVQRDSADNLVALRVKVQENEGDDGDQRENGYGSSPVQRPASSDGASNSDQGSGGDENDAPSLPGVTQPGPLPTATSAAAKPSPTREGEDEIEGEHPASTPGLSPPPPPSSPTQGPDDGGEDHGDDD